MKRARAAPRADRRAGFGLAAAIAAVAVVATVAGAFGLMVAWYLSSGGPAPPEQSGGGSQTEQARYTYVPFGSTVANLSEGRLTRYVKVNVTLQVKQEQAEQVQRVIDGGKKALFQDWLLAYLSDKQLDEVKGGAALAKLRRDIQEGFNSILAEYGEGRVEGVLFTEFNVQ
ncbi:MAG: flagellar basal body-associated FliL family protein [Candidatus Brocadiia bacterium]